MLGDRPNMVISRPPLTGNGGFKNAPNTLIFHVIGFKCYADLIIRHYYCSLISEKKGAPKHDISWIPCAMSQDERVRMGSLEDLHRWNYDEEA